MSVSMENSGTSMVSPDGYLREECAVDKRRSKSQLCLNESPGWLSSGMELTRLRSYNLSYLKFSFIIEMNPYVRHSI